MADAPQRFRRIATERACASKPSASASVIAAGPSARRLCGVELQERRALHEVEDGKPRGEARRARRRQHVVGAGDVVADHLRRMASDEDRAGIADSPAAAPRDRRRQLEMLRRDAIDERRRFGKAGDKDDRAEIAPARARRLAARQRRELPLDGLLPRRSASTASSVIRIACADASCSACARRSAAIQAGSFPRSATTSTSEGPAIMSMPTCPNTCRFAAATKAFPGPMIFITGATVAVP